jgi:hypothetical protein
MMGVDTETPIGSTPPETGVEPGRVHISLPPGIDDFQKALLLEQRALCDALATVRCGIQDLLNPLVADLYALLRSPIHPKKGYLALADALVKAVACEERRVHLQGVLASPTAMTEVRSILHCAAIFQRHGLKPQLKLFLARWENLVEIQHESAAARALAFFQQVRGVREVAQRAGFADAVIPIDVEADSTTGEILYPLDVRDWSRRVLSASADPRGACPSLARDVVWSIGFHARQASLSRLGEPQALFDLALRRALGQRISTEHASHSQLEGGVSAMVTLELHKRFLPCYAASLPIINLDGRAPVPDASTSAVA